MDLGCFLAKPGVREGVGFLSGLLARTWGGFRAGVGSVSLRVGFVWFGVRCLERFGSFRFCLGEISR